LNVFKFSFLGGFTVDLRLVLYLMYIMATVGMTVWVGRTLHRAGGVADAGRGGARLGIADRLPAGVVLRRCLVHM